MFFENSEKYERFEEQDVSLYPQIFSKFWFKDPLAFLQKGKKTAELVFLFYLKSGLKFQNNLINSFLISKDFRIIHIRII